MKRNVKISRSVFGFICLFLALGITFGLSPFLQRVSSARVTIARVSADVEKGAVIPDTAIESVSVGGYNLPENLARVKADVVGKYAVTDLRKGDFLLESKISAEAPVTDAYLVGMPEGKRALSVSVKSFANGLSGKLLAGDIVTAIVLDDNKKAVMPVELRYLKVLAVTLSGGADKRDNGEAPAAQEVGKVQTVATLTLLVDAQQACRLAELEAASWTQFALVSRGDREKASLLLAEQDKAIAAIPVETMAASEKTALTASQAPNE